MKLKEADIHSWMQAKHAVKMEKGYVSIALRASTYKHVFQAYLRRGVPVCNPAPSIGIGIGEALK